MAYDCERFVKKIKELKGDESVSAFARKCGISQGNLYRLLNRGADKPPRKDTLRQIANATGANLEELFIICDYATTASGARKERSVDERIRLNAKDMKDGFESLVNSSNIYDSIEDFLDIWKTVYSVESCTFCCGEINEYEGSLHKTAENYVNIWVRFGDVTCTCYTYATLYFCETKGGKVVMLGAALDGKSLLEGHFMSDANIAKLGYTRESIEQANYFCHVVETKEGKLLRAIFDNNSDEYQYPLVGTGFDVSFVPEKLGDFLKNHELPEGCEPYTEGDPEEHTGDYRSTEYDEDGFEGVIAAVMRKETGLPFRVYSSYYSEIDGRNAVSIMVLKEEDETRNYYDSVLDAARRYAEELGIEEYGEQVIYITRVHEPVYKTKKEGR